MHILIITTEWPTNNNPCAVPFLTHHVDLLRKSGIEIEIYHFQGKKNPVNYICAWWKIRKIAYWKKADILHAHWGQSAFLALFSKKKLVITFHGSDLHGIVNSEGKITIQGKILRNFSQLMAVQADYCIVVSNGLMKLLPKRIKKVKTIPSGIDAELFFPMDKVICRDKLELDKFSKIVLFISDPSRTEKRFSLARDAVNEYKWLHPEVQIQLLVVNGIDHSLIPQYINSGDVLILTSTHEGGPAVVKEALACKLPIVSFDVGDVAERISNVDGCYLCKEQTIECLVKGLEIAITHGPLQNLPESAIKQLDERKNVSEVIKIYKTLVKDNR